MSSPSISLALASSSLSASGTPASSAPCAPEAPPSPPSLSLSPCSGVLAFGFGIVRVGILLGVAEIDVEVTDQLPRHLGIAVLVLEVLRQARGSRARPCLRGAAATPTIMRRAEGGGTEPVSASRASKRTASGSIAGSRSVTWAKPWRRQRSSRCAARLAATPAMRCAPSASTRACSMRLEQLPRLVGGRAALGMHRVVVIAQPQRGGVGGAAQLRCLFLAQLAPGQRQTHARAADRRQLGAIDDVDVLAFGDRPHGGGGGALEDLDGGFGFGHVQMTGIRNQGSDEVTSRASSDP